MQLLLIRHALPERVELDEGRADPSLTAVGRAQADALAAHLADEPISAVYTSPLARAAETAAPLAAALGVDAIVEPDVAEFDRDAASYIPMEELSAEELTAIADGRWTTWGGDPVELRRRVVAALERIIDGHPGQTVAVVCHGGVINAFVGHILGIERPAWFMPDYTSISRILASRAGHRGVDTLNERHHLRTATSPAGSGA